MKRRFVIHWNQFTNTVLSRTIKKYGKEDFIVEVLEQVDTWDEACEKEISYIKELNTKIPNGMNMTNGGDGVYGLEHSLETRKKMSLSHKGKGMGKDNPMYGKPGTMLGKEFSKEHKKNLSKAMKGKTAWNKGKKFPQFSGKNNSFYGKQHSEETKNKISEANSGNKWTEETRKKMIINRKGKQAGEKHSQAKLSEVSVLEIRQKYFDKEFNQKEIAIQYDITPSMVSNIVRYKSWTHLNNKEAKK